MDYYTLGGVTCNDRFRAGEDEALEDEKTPSHGYRFRDQERRLYDEFRRELKRDRAGVIPGWFACVLALLGIFSVGAVFIPFALLFCLVGFLSSVLALNARGFFISIFASILTAIGFIVSPSAWLALASIIVSLKLN